MSHAAPSSDRRGEARQFARQGLWLSAPVLAIASVIWIWEPTGQWVFAAAVGACALALPWGLLAAFPVWLVVLALGKLTSLNPYALLYWGIAVTAAIGAHLNAYLLLARAGERSAPENSAP